MAIDDLWGELPDVEEIKTPFVILKEQAELLTEKTDGLLVGEATRKQVKQRFYCTLDIVVPILNDYKYNLLSIYYGIRLYPVDLEVNKQCVSGSDEDEFKKELGNILKSQKIQDVISKLLAHVRSA